MPTTPLSSPDAALLALRPAIAGQPAPVPTPTAVADFQNQVLRPLLKLQHAALLATVADFAADYHLNLSPDAPTEVARVLTDLLTRNVRLRATLTGLVTGLFTSTERAVYRQHRNELNRRLLDLAQQRVLTSLDDLRHQSALRSTPLL